jgi:hypothetical protein
MDDHTRIPKNPLYTSSYYSSLELGVDLLAVRIWYKWKKKKNPSNTKNSNTRPFCGGKVQKTTLKTKTVRKVTNKVSYYEE